MLLSCCSSNQIIRPQLTLPSTNISPFSLKLSNNSLLRNETNLTSIISDTEYEFFFRLGPFLLVSHAIAFKPFPDHSRRCLASSPLRAESCEQLFFQMKITRRARRKITRVQFLRRRRKRRVAVAACIIS